MSMNRICCPWLLWYICENRIFPGGWSTGHTFLGDGSVGVIQYCPYCGTKVEFEFETTECGMNKISSECAGEEE